MSVSDREMIASVKKWLVYADEDIRLARHGLTLSSSVPYRLLAYHAQQCAEKCLKAYLVYRCIDFPYTHNISMLLELCSRDASWTVGLMDAEELTSYAITTRYPGIDEDVSREETLRAIQLASLVMKTVTDALAKEDFK
ncbi:MAG: HEPN domain-containing protein [Deltaproteobacteria bacterium]|nr:HEPN domain-containing protein [Deltaproteobacteria bacterium]